MATSGDAGQRRTVDAGSMTETTSPNVQLVNDAYTAFIRGDMDAVVDALHPDIEWKEAEHSPWHAAGGHHGAEAVLTNVFARIPRYFESFEVDPRCFHDAGETVIVEGRYRASAVNTADPLDAQVCHVWTIRGSKLTAFRQYTDTWQFARITGSPPA